MLGYHPLTQNLLFSIDKIV